MAMRPNAQAIPGRDGWYLTGVMRKQSNGRESTEVQITWYEHEATEQGSTRTFTLSGMAPRSVIFDAAIEHIDAWAT